MCLTALLVSGVLLWWFFQQPAGALVEEQTVARASGGQWSQPFVPGEDLLDECRRLEAIGAAERTPLHAVGAGLEPHKCLTIVEQRQGLQAVAAEFGDRIGIAGRVDHDGEVVGIDVFEQPDEGSRLVGVGNALRRGGLTTSAYASDVCLAGPQERSQFTCRHLAA